MKRIVVGIDGSEQSWTALDHAVELARATGATLQLAHVMPESLALPMAEPSVSDVTTDWQRAQEEYGKGLLRVAVARAKGEALELDCVLKSGPAAESLAAMAERPEVTMVVVGHRGRNLAARLLVGSVADRLVQISPKPVLVVR